MMELKKVQTAEEYLIYYEEAIEWDQVVKLFPKTKGKETELFSFSTIPSCVATVGRYV